MNWHRQPPDHDGLTNSGESVSQFGLPKAFWVVLVLIILFFLSMDKIAVTFFPDKGGEAVTNYGAEVRDAAGTRE
ncbi:MAG: hypothetical protein KDC26_09125 [Armatimonadetes bacterium]|nr:hypothetical protein [Armatimonadota bacterium]